MQSTPAQSPTQLTPQLSVVTTNLSPMTAPIQSAGARSFPVSAVASPVQAQSSLLSSGPTLPTVSMPYTQAQRTASALVLPPKPPASRTEPARTAAADHASPAARQDAAAANAEQSRPKAKKRKTMPVDLDFIEADLDWYQHTRSGDASNNAGPQGANSAGPSSMPSTPFVKQEPGVASAPQVSGSISMTPAFQETAGAVLPAEAIRVDLQSRSSPVPLGDAPTSPPTAKDNAATGDAPLPSAGNAETAPKSPEILGPSLTRHPSQTTLPDPPSTVVLTAAADPPVDPPSNDPSPSALPSPFAMKKPRKKRKGPPGLKFLPIMVPSGDGTVESLAVEEPVDNDSAPAPKARQVLSETFGRAPLLASEPSSAMGSRQGSPAEARPSASSEASRKGTPMLVDSPIPMEVDADEPELARAVNVAPIVNAHNAAAIEEQRAFRDAGARDPTTTAVTIQRAECNIIPPAGVHEESSAAVIAAAAVAAVEQSSPMHSTPPPPHPAGEPSTLIPPGDESASQSPVHISGLPSSMDTPPTVVDPLMHQETGAGSTHIDTVDVSSMAPAPLLATHASTDTTASPLETAAPPLTVSATGSSSDSVSSNAKTIAVTPVSAPADEPMTIDRPPTAIAPANITASSDVPQDLSPFVATAARVLSMVRGAPSMTPASRPVQMAFELTAEELAKIARWNKRDKITDDLSDSLCLSFVSYLVSQCVLSTIDELESISDITQCGKPPPWPRDSSFIVLNDSEGANSLVIAPPFVTTPDKCADLSTRSLREGRNTIKLYQYSDHSDRIFVVLLHHPTRAQLAEHEASRAEDRRWRETLAELWKFEVRVPRIFPPSTFANGSNGRL
ncbi:hypothetical protein BN946_scf184687.g8 [Trametes cinnabarina]|uniref:Uncharacterized protein n=1 Tax=Pycnoporus cinnabarinus TaxID=5643 RepID=A0A060SBG0_PYCCI|nr:hypothetical protein BN946_scf184687.g8 [Trametes cinnabarina]